MLVYLHLHHQVVAIAREREHSEAARTVEADSRLLLGRHGLFVRPKVLPVQRAQLRGGEQSISDDECPPCAESRHRLEGKTMQYRTSFRDLDDLPVIDLSYGNLSQRFSPFSPLTFSTYHR